MQPQVRYVKSSDGTRLAVSTLGDGRPLVIVRDTMSISIEGHWEIPEIRGNLERLAANRKLVLYDSRGVGLSTRDLEDFSIKAAEGDLEAVVDSLDVPSVDLLAPFFAGPLTINFTAHKPDKVRKLILIGAVSRGRDVHPPRELRDLRSLVESNWELYLQTQALIFYGWTDEGRRWAERLTSDVSKDAYLKSFAEFRNSDVTAQLPQVLCPTLVMHLRDGGGVSMEVSRGVAAAIPNARLSTYLGSGRDASWLADDWDSTLGSVVAFLDEESESERESHLPEGTALILFADIVDSTALTERLGDAAFRDKARELNTSLRSLIRECAGTPVEGPTLGDGVLAAFSSAREAIEAARRCATAGDDAGLPLHLGLHAGHVTREKDSGGRSNVYGGAVNIAARISGLSAPGEVLVSQTVRDIARTSAGVTFADRGEQSLKGVADPVRLFAVS